VANSYSLEAYCAWRTVSLTQSPGHGIYSNRTRASCLQALLRKHDVDSTKRRNCVVEAMGTHDKEALTSLWSTVIVLCSGERHIRPRKDGELPDRSCGAVLGEDVDVAIFDAHCSGVAMGYNSLL
jgi:hypothetical protein